MTTRCRFNDSIVNFSETVAHRQRAFWRCGKRAESASRARAKAWTSTSLLQDQSCRAPK